MEMPQGSGAHGEAAGPDGPLSLSPPLSPASAAAAALANSRWNPTKEQVAVLEGLYEHGLRTPNAEQIQQITARLREHGHVEGKSVFYWFQNHKARQRQKQKQENFAYFTRLLRRPPPLPMLARPPGPPYPHGRMPSPPVMAVPPPRPAACNNGGGTHVVYRAPYYMPAPPPAPAANACYYNPQLAHHIAVMYPRMEVAQDKQLNQAAAQTPASMYQQAAPYNESTALHSPHFQLPANGVGSGASADVGRPSRETLELFPLQPTFLLLNKGRGAASASQTTSASASFSGESESMESPNSKTNALPFYDFCGLQSGGR